MDDKEEETLEHGLGLGWGREGEETARTVTLSSLETSFLKPGPWDGPGGTALPRAQV